MRRAASERTAVTCRELQGRRATLTLRAQREGDVVERRSIGVSGLGRLYERGPAAKLRRQRFGSETSRDFDPEFIKEPNCDPRNIGTPKKRVIDGKPVSGLRFASSPQPFDQLIYMPFLVSGFRHCGRVKTGIPKCTKTCREA